MNSCLVVFTVFICLVASGYGLNCYVCDDCLQGIASYTSNQDTCPFDLLGTGRCAKEIEGDGTVNRYCATIADCSVKEALNKCTDDNGPCTICCEDDLCNSSTMTTITLATFLSTILACWFAWLQ